MQYAFASSRTSREYSRVFPLGLRHYHSPTPYGELMASLQKIAPCLWFDTQAEAAANFYIGIFKNSKIKEVSRYTDAGKEVHHQKPGSVMTVAFDLDGTRFTALNGGPLFKFSEAISFQV